MQYERQVKQFKQSLNDHTHTVEAIKKEGGGYSEVNWIKLSEVRHLWLILEPLYDIVNSLSW